MKILISDAFDASLPGKLARFGETFDDKSRLSEADVVLIRSKTTCTREYIDKAASLKLIIRGGVGLDNVDQDYAKQKGIAVHNTAAASSIAVAELAMGFMTAIPANIIPGHISLTKGEWQKKQLKRTELYGKTLGLIGIGKIATETAIRAKAFGMKVIAYDKYIDKSKHAEMVSFNDLLIRSDFISLHVPYTDETREMINKSTIKQMKDGVIIVNTGRGKCINEADMAEALRNGKVRAYGTDVWYSDPPDWDGCPLLTAPNVYMTPHIGASTTENLLRIGDVIEEILNAYVKEGKL
ncbi:MAG: hydroxyacid dehydrogenase [Candidatus Eisenbacteria bacterium]|uniref:Hydroxyacid dehydrogenase n=1 Tax=Eiseniibacteriota bacterium TaxID=2212470 RepID=A0A948RY86_UNCEI|nr:hydroxyacid dehydrogenase [Candidatus Eisenbacteria bacterium]MBU1949366.1 hydroxyacid dehydrogenase [Candidatus Eisenbacteria bacterium]MBU2690439.1 hydroxyacid dehydrogenase [Candidatus Eisenbacteria bacterium]